MADKKANVSRDLELKSVAGGVSKRKLTASDIAILRNKIAEIRALEIEGRIAKLLQRNLGVADTQLRDIVGQLDGELIDQKAFESLPPHLRQRVLTRLDNVAKRLADGLDQNDAAPFRDPAFKCISDFDACQQKARDAGTSAFWCHASMIVCLVRTVLPRLSGASQKPSGSK